MSRYLNSNAIWTQTPLANRTITVSDKTGFSLTAGSYSVRASSCQRAVITQVNTESSVTATVSSVTTTRALLSNCSEVGDQTGNSSAVLIISALTSATVVTSTRMNVTGSAKASFDLGEWF
jgi:hypothetical protein